MDVKVLETIRKNLFSMLDSSVSYEEWAEEFVNILRKIVPNQLICKMIMDCYIVKNCDYFGRFVVWLCSVNEYYRAIYEEIFKNTYELRLPDPDLHQIYDETKFFALLFRTNSISWKALSCIKLKDNYSDSSKEYFTMLLLLEISKGDGISNLCEQLKNPTLKNELNGLFPKDNLEVALYAVKVLELVDLHVLTHDLYEYINSYDELSIGVQHMSLQNI